MDKDRIKGKVEDIAGRAERQADEWTGDKKAEQEGMKHQIKGKARNAMDQVKDAAWDTMKEVRGEDAMDRDIDWEKGAA